MSALQVAMKILLQLLQDLFHKLVAELTDGRSVFCKPNKVIARTQTKEIVSGNLDLYLQI